MLFKSSFLPGGKGTKLVINPANVIAFIAGFAIMIPMIVAGNTDEAKDCLLYTSKEPVYDVKAY